MLNLNVDKSSSSTCSLLKYRVLFSLLQLVAEGTILS